MKACPYCAEEIQDAAIVCRFCNRELMSGEQPRPMAAPVTAAPSPGVAAVLSFFIPGLGQIYRGRIGSGLLWLVVTVAGYMMLIVPGIILHLTSIVMAGSKDAATSSEAMPAPTPRTRTAEQIALDRAADRRFMTWFGAAAVGLVLVSVVMSLLKPNQPPPGTAARAPMKSGFEEPNPNGSNVERQVRLAASIRLTTACADVTRAFHQGLDRPSAESVWNATCLDGNSYVVRYSRLSPETPPAVSRCGSGRSGPPCFTALP